MPYYLHLFSHSPVQCNLIGDGPGRASAIASGKWSGKSAGGCFNHQTWINNPKYLMKFGKSSGNYDVEFVLIQGSKTTCYIGLYIFGGYQEGQGLSTNQCVKQVQCINRNEISVKVQMPSSSGQFMVMPTTFKAGETNDFQLIILTEDKLSLIEVDGTAQALKSVAKVPEVNPKPNVKQPSGYSLVIAPGGGSKPLPLSKEVSGSSSPVKSPISSSSSSKSSQTSQTTVPAKPMPKPYTAPKSNTQPVSSPKPYTAPKSTPKPYTAPKSKSTVMASPSKGTSMDISKDRKGDVILTFGSKSKSNNKSNVIESFYCGGCGASQKKGAKQCTSCGVKLKK